MACSHYVVRSFHSVISRMTYLRGISLCSSAGVDTTSTTMSWWTLAMVAYPEIQLRAQRELDAVVGRSRIPTHADMPHLPYICAIIKEILRWRPAGPLGL